MAEELPSNDAALARAWARYREAANEGLLAASPADLRGITPREYRRALREIERLRAGLMLTRQYIRAGRARDWAVDAIRHTLAGELDPRELLERGSPGLGEHPQPVSEPAILEQLNEHRDKLELERERQARAAREQEADEHVARGEVTAYASSEESLASLSELTDAGDEAHERDQRRGAAEQEERLQRLERALGIEGAWDPQTPVRRPGLTVEEQIDHLRDYARYLRYQWAQARAWLDEARELIAISSISASD
jgi:hypothetical protein